MTSAAAYNSLKDDSDVDEDEPSSIEDQLEKFRSDWKNELSSQTNETDTQEVEERARDLFMKGVQSEQCGSVYEAVAYYRRAVRLVPDIEFKIEELRISAEEVRERQRTESSSSLDSVSTNEIFDCEDLVEHFSKVKMSEKTICEKGYQQTTTHISVLPAEVFQYILRWTVSASMDLRSLEMFSMVCRGFYLLARDVTLWKMACAQTWRWSIPRLPSKYPTWRDMYVKKERLHFNGVYISRASYFRKTENEFGAIQQTSWCFVVYYRYARFFPNGYVVMLTTPEEPCNVVSKLKNTTVEMEGMQYGHYTVKGDEVRAVMKHKIRLGYQSNSRYKRNRPKYDYDAGENTFHAIFNLKSNQHKGTSKLTWKDYFLITQYRNDSPNKTQFDIEDSRHPPLSFSRVVSFTAVSEEVLDFPTIPSK